MHVSKNGVNTCPPVSEYEILNAPKFSALMTPFRNKSSQFGIRPLKLNNSSPILPQIPRIPQPPRLDISTLFAHRQYYRWRKLPMDRPGNPAQWNISRSWPLPVKSPAQSLDYRANSYHIYLSTLGFHGCDKEINQICPCPFCPINTSFSGTPSPSHHSRTPTLLFWRQHCSIAPRTPTRTSFNNPRVFDLLPCQKMAVNFIVPEVSSTSLLYFNRIPVHPQFILLNAFFLSFALPQKFLGSVQ